VIEVEVFPTTMLIE